MRIFVKNVFITVPCVSYATEYDSYSVTADINDKSLTYGTRILVLIDILSSLVVIMYYF